MRSAASVLPRLCIIFVLVAPSSPLRAHTAVIKIRVVNVSNNRPMSRQSVSLALGYGKGERTPAEYAANPRLETDVNGEAQFRLPEPAPAHLVAQVHLTSEYWHCICFAIETTQDVTQKGVVQLAARDSLATGTNAKAEPGLILFLARPFTFFERLLYPLMKE